MSRKTSPQDSPTTSAAGERRTGTPFSQGELALWIVGALGSALLVSASVVQHRFLWLTGINALAVYGGMFVLLNALRLGHRRLARGCRIVPVITMVLSTVAVALPG
ncbi:hypothetical protein RCO28_28360 [Streptomyces sp. LHD-70]|uniref:hypothetical protein n=1 Tax=Streptomyces sp. LHD-70 TaxID=3072140 RepID=UPI00280C52AC|nr:hypothetical protein [Streptomyces sp. LHD-70]MDQ8706355.1 hypothetical protein [Streptomyces sp. LHD-70]